MSLTFRQVQTFKKFTVKIEKVFFLTKEVMHCTRVIKFSRRGQVQVGGCRWMGKEFKVKSGDSFISSFVRKSVCKRDLT